MAEGRERGALASGLSVVKWKWSAEEAAKTAERSTTERYLLFLASPVSTSAK